MSRECSWKKTEEVQIDLLDLLRRLCRQWKRIVMCAVLCAVLAGAVSYVLSKNGIGRTTDEESEESAAQPEVVEEAIPLTREEQIQGVAAARQLALEIEELQTYVDHSVLMQVDPYHKNSVQLLFRVEGATGWTMQKIVEKYLNFLANDASVDAICSIDSEMERIGKCYLSELFWAAQKTSGTYLDEEGNTMTGVLLSAEVTGMNAAMAKDLAADIQAVLEEYHSTVKKECGTHTLTLLSSEEKERADSSLLAQQREKRTLLTTDQANLKAMVDAFDDEQKIMYAARESELQEQEGTDVPLDVESEGQKVGGTQSDAESEEQKDAGTQAGSGFELEGRSDQDAGSEETKGSVSVLYVLLGLFAGIFVYCAAYACWYLMRDTVKSAGEFQSYYTFPFYGSISLRGREGTNGASREAYEREKAQMLHRVRLSCRKREVTRLCLATDFSMNEQEKACIEDLLKQLKEWKLDVALAENIGGNISMWDALAETGTVLMVCRLGNTTHCMIDDVMEFYLENGVSVLGAAALE